MRFIFSWLVLSLAAAAQASSITTPEATLRFESADGHAIAGVSLTGMLGYSVIVAQDCTGFICMPSLPHRVRKSEGGQVLGQTNANGILQVESMEWTTSRLTAKNLSVTYFTNGTLDVYCDENEADKIAGFVELLPQWKDGKLVERDYECSNLEFKQGDEKEIFFNCKSPLTIQEIQNKISEIKSGCE